MQLKEVGVLTTCQLYQEAVRSLESVFIEVGAFCVHAEIVVALTARYGPPPLMARQRQVVQGVSLSRLRNHTQTPHSVGLLWTSDQPDAETSYLTAHNIHKRQTAMPPKWPLTRIKYMNCKCSPSEVRNVNDR
jgi:hypothetical protein